MSTHKKRHISHPIEVRRSRMRHPRETEEQTPTIEEIEQMYRQEHPDWPERDIRMATLVFYTDQLDHVDAMVDQARRDTYHGVVLASALVDERRGKKSSWSGC